MLVYLDDILIYSRNEQEHQEQVENILEKLREHQLYGNWTKSEFEMEELEYFGHIVSKDGIKVDPKKISAIRDWPKPNSHRRSLFHWYGLLLSAFYQELRTYCIPS